MGCTEKAIKNKKPLLPAEWESFRNIWKGGPFEVGNMHWYTYRSRSILADH